MDFDPNGNPPHDAAEFLIVRILRTGRIIIIQPCSKKRELEASFDFLKRGVHFGFPLLRLRNLEFSSLKNFDRIFA